MKAERIKVLTESYLTQVGDCLTIIDPYSLFILFIFIHFIHYSLMPYYLIAYLYVQMIRLIGT